MRVHVDNDAAHHSGRSFELALEIAGSVLLASARAGQTCVLALGDDPVIEAHGPNAAATLLRALAGAEARSDRRLIGRADRDRDRDGRDAEASFGASGTERFTDGVAVLGPLHPPVDHHARVVLVAAPPETGVAPLLDHRRSRARGIASLDDLRDQWQDLRVDRARR